MKNARQRYQELSSHREQFLDVAYECAELTLLVAVELEDLTDNEKRTAAIPRVIESP